MTSSTEFVTAVNNFYGKSQQNQYRFQSEAAIKPKSLSFSIDHLLSGSKESSKSSSESCYASPKSSSFEIHQPTDHDAHLHHPYSTNPWVFNMFSQQFQQNCAPYSTQYFTKPMDNSTYLPDHKVSSNLIDVSRNGDQSQIIFDVLSKCFFFLTNRDSKNWTKEFLMKFNCY